MISGIGMRLIGINQDNSKHVLIKPIRIYGDLHGPDYLRGEPVSYVERAVL